MENFDNKLGNLLRELRTEKGMSLREFSEYLSISHAYLNKLEKGFDPRSKRPITPTIETLQKIAGGLNLPMENFLSTCGYLADTEELESVLELNVLAQEFINTVLDAPKITLNGEPVSGDKHFLLQTALQTLQTFLSLDK